jgi:ATP-binding cassette subfamily C protein LapB
MRNQTNSSGQKLSWPTGWRRPDVLAASLTLNVLALALPFTILQIYDRIIPNAAHETLAVLLSALLVVIGLEFLIRFMRSYLLAAEAARFDHLGSMKAVDHILGVEASEFDRHSSAYFLERINALDRVQEFYSGQAMLLVMDLPFVVLFLLMVYLIAGGLVAVPLTLLAIFTVVAWISGNRLHSAVERRTQMEEQRQNVLIEILQGIHTVKAMAMEAPMVRRYQRLQSRSADSVYELARIGSIVQSVGATFSQLAVISFVGFGAAYVIDGSLSIGGLAAGTLLAGRVLQPGLRAMAVFTQYQSVRLAHKRVDELFALRAEPQGGQAVDGVVDGEIELKDVTFAYPGEPPLLQDVSLKISPGEAIAITGRNGVGKSTLLKLLSGYLHPDTGSVMIDGIDIDAYDLSSLRRQIAYLPQHGTLFEGSILENLTLYREGEAVSHAIELSRQLGLDATISKLPEGLDTPVNGAALDSLPGGVKKKITMVRSLVGQHGMLLFDDANANLDIRNDAKLLELLKALKGQMTMVIVTHRPSYVRACDRHFVLEDRGLHEITPAEEQPRVSMAGSATGRQQHG